MPESGSSLPFAAAIDAWLAAIVESSDDAIIGKTLDGTIRSWNAGATRVFGYEAHEIIGRSVLTLIPPHLRHEEREIVARVARGDRFDHYETVRMRKDGVQIDVSLSVSPIRDRSAAVIGAAKIARDVTMAKRLLRAERELKEQVQRQTAELEEQVEAGQALHEELERTLELAREAQRVAEEANVAKSQFLAMMSHELRTPLNAIAGYIELLMLGIRGPLTDAQRYDLGRIRHSEETLLRLIEDVLSFAKLESGRLEYHFGHVSLDNVLLSLDAFVAPRLTKKGLVYDCERCGPELTIWTDRDKLEQIMLNLLSNAVKFTESGRITIRCVPHVATVQILVADTGRGIPPDLREAIFEPFIQGERPLTRTAEGTGLGLAISRELARGLGGDIVVESQVGVGSTFTVTLPRNASDRAIP